MRELTIGRNDSEQRLDRYLKKYLNKANNSFIYKMLRKKNIKLNNSKAHADAILKEGDVIALYLSDETIDKFRDTSTKKRQLVNLDIIYEDNNLLVINKNAGLLVHGTGNEFEKNIVDGVIEYLIAKGEYIPRLEKTFTPAVSNRLDRNTSGLIIAAKNSESLKAINKAIHDGKIEKYYLTIVKGEVKSTIYHTGNLIKDHEKNKVSFVEDSYEGKETETVFKPIKTNNGYTLLEVDLITGRTHQIRSTLQFLKHPIIGDKKYGDKYVNERFEREYGLKSQWLHAYKLVFNGFEDNLNYLNNKVITSKPNEMFSRIKNTIFEED